MARIPKRDARVLAHHRVIAAVGGALALCLAVPVAALGSASPQSANRQAVVDHHMGDNQSHVEISGTIVSVGNGSIVVRDGDGFWRTVVLGTSTAYVEGPMKVMPGVTANDLAIGSVIAASGSVDADHTSLDATSVHIELSTVRGSVASISSTSMTVSMEKPSTTRTVDLNSQTVVFSHSGIVLVSSLSMGSVVEAFGLLQPDGSLLALYVGVGQSHGDSFDHGSDFGFTLPNRAGPNHYGEHKSRN